ncbi:type IV toxin-antitoxin system AbiEi family antitoxin domain-containing protein [Nucisporomicrobium flavum]|uniref:type IV toxin-antitoxin system AbiEi family antitoxin domain-containing protein n=1 Tax=Nucisporomicrobium flavum TaxID=2785915 RepID=UPI0018F285C4|nr:type IV toxin-antitoxin system AbiEi family antitoxin domain-containing protein [Nucisporomicrobium flavum]
MAGLAGLPSTFTTGQARAAGLHPRDLYAAREGGGLIELSRGVFRRADAPAAAHPDLLAVSLRAPRAVVCLLSAAAVHDLTDEIPMAVQIAVPRRTWPPKLDHPPVEVFVWDPATFELGLDSVEVAPGERARIYSPGRTAVDLMRMRNKLGESVAHIALRRYLGRRDARIAELFAYAKALDVLGPVRAVVDVLAAS